MGSSDWAPRCARLPYLTMQQVYTGPSVRRLADFGAQAEGWSERAGQDWESCGSAWSDFWRAPTQLEREHAGACLLCGALDRPVLYVQDD